MEDTGSEKALAKANERRVVLQSIASRTVSDDPEAASSLSSLTVPGAYAVDDGSEPRLDRLERRKGSNCREDALSKQKAGSMDRNTAVQALDQRIAAKRASDTTSNLKPPPPSSAAVKEKVTGKEDHRQGRSTDRNTAVHTSPGRKDCC